MADSSFGSKIGLECGGEFKRVIADISREMRVKLGYESAVVSQFAENAAPADVFTVRNRFWQMR